MGLHGKLIAAIEFKASGDVFHEIFRHRLQELCTANPNIQGCDLHEGQFGQVGAIISWTYTHAKEVIETIDEEKRLIVLKVLEGDLLEKYKSSVITSHVETKGDNIDLVMWTLDYEMLNEDVGHPISLFFYFIDITKHIEAHCIPCPTA
ncbi:hypothetical protein C2S53_011797 [Perilla frutescens var. hirtella]|uniref:Bet v I/Major latex protein domain-containing protein n=1 Tax=Perilla frutescens var. hirtella TaxID=608512 RepID=A0AAD4PBU5_PERFH|nr:hypothetical protein C2S51_020884 [Perilla frutescens var. frutescens]KAH6833395.1 hypothetical protein C2S53_011797 [Perilla frutescens var. hirtella]